MCTLQSYKTTLSLLNWPQDLEEKLLVLELVFIAYLLPRALYVRKHTYPSNFSLFSKTFLLKPRNQRNIPDYRSVYSLQERVFGSLRFKSSQSTLSLTFTTRTTTFDEPNESEIFISKVSL